jgi:hypothetical protein
MQALVLTAAALAAPTKPSIHVSDGDALLKVTTFKVTLNQPAALTWRIVNSTGDTVRTVKTNSQTAAGITSYTWDGKNDAGAWVADGRYRSVVTAQTGLGSYSQERSVFVGPFQVNPSIASPVRGGKITLTVISTESLSKKPKVRITQPGVDPWTVTASHVSGRKYKVTITLKVGGTEGTVAFLIRGIDSKGGAQSSALTLPLR